MTTEWQSLSLALATRKSYGCMLNKNLEQQALAIFDDMFSDVSAGNKLIGDIITPKRGKGLLSKDAVFGDAPVVAGGLEPATYHNKIPYYFPLSTRFIWPNPVI